MNESSLGLRGDRWNYNCIKIKDCSGLLFMAYRIYYRIKSLEGSKFDVKPEKLFETLSNTNITLLSVFLRYHNIVAKRNLECQIPQSFINSTFEIDKIYPWHINKVKIVKSQQSWCKGITGDNRNCSLLQDINNFVFIVIKKVQLDWWVRVNLVVFFYFF